MNIPEPTAWIDAIFSVFDSALLSLLHRLAVETQGVLTQPFALWGVITDNGLVFLAAGLTLLFWRPTRSLGAQLVASVGLAGVLAYAIKLAVARPRPFLLPSYHQWWKTLGLPAESGFAFPSGHVATVMAAAAVCYVFFEKRWSWVFFLPVVFTGLTRCYLQVHYPSDVLAGLVVGLIGAGLATVTLRRLGFPK